MLNITGQVSAVEPGPEDLKIITLARSARARVASAEGAAVRDETGRTYAAAAVALPSLKLSALRLAVAMAVSSGASSLEAAALVSDVDAADPADLAVVRGPARPRSSSTPAPTACSAKRCSLAPGALCASGAWSLRRSFARSSLVSPVGGGAPSARN